MALARTEVPFVRVAALDAASRLDGDVPWSSLGSFVGERTLARALVRFAIRANESGAAAFVARQLSGGARGPLLDATLALAARIASETKDAPAFGALREALRGIDLAEVASRPVPTRASRSDGAKSSCSDSRRRSSPSVT
ncbi:MAG: hypothetical protein U0169_08975 [Polyangiaceae bacterium]